MSHNPPQPSPRSALNLALRWAEQGRLPDAMLRAGIRTLLRERLQELRSGDAQATAAQTAAFLESLRHAPLALHPEAANAQHYELPPEFFAQVLGPHRKYSSCHWGEQVQTLEQAEAEALAISCERAQLRDGQRVLELGCGWGSLSLWMAQHYAHSQILAVSNSHAQRAYIEAQAAQRGLHNLKVQTCDFNDFDSTESFDRIVSIEMFEHLRNWPRAFAQVARWLTPGGRFFMHVFTHREAAYPFEARDASDWMSQYFFTGGMMPSDDLALMCQDDLQLQGHWRWDGTHYERTAGAWLARMDARKREIMPLFVATYGADQASVWWVRWRLFFMAVEELFGYAGGQQWWVSHYLFGKR